MKDEFERRVVSGSMAAGTRLTDVVLAHGLVSVDEPIRPFGGSLLLPLLAAIRVGCAYGAAAAIKAGCDIEPVLSDGCADTLELTRRHGHTASFANGLVARMALMQRRLASATGTGASRPAARRSSRAQL